MRPRTTASLEMWSTASSQGRSSPLKKTHSGFWRRSDPSPVPVFHLVGSEIVSPIAVILPKPDFGDYTNRTTMCEGGQPGAA